MPAVDPYDDLPYTDHAYAESHPDRLAVVARLSGWAPPAVEGARILELGCGRGGNLLPMASGLPRATLLGIDRSERQIAEARDAARAAGLDNVRFEALPVESVDGRALGDAGFDFVVCHGLCSWVPPATRPALLALVGGALAPGGLAYVSFNVLPGWYERLAARDWLRAFPADDPRASLAWLRDAVSPELADYRRRLDAVARRLGETERAYAVHEYLAQEHHPQRIDQMLAEATTAGLAYLGDAIPAETALELLPEPVVARAQSLGATGAQQLVDFVRCTAFRRAVLVRRADAEARRWQWPSHLDASALSTLRVATRSRPGPTAPPDDTPFELFDGPGGSVQVDELRVRRVLRALARVAPRSLPFDALTGRLDSGDAGKLARELLELWLATGAIDLHAHEPPIGDASAARPRACPVARQQAARAAAVTNRWHQQVRFDDPVLLFVLERLDGTRTRGELAAALEGAPGGSALDAAERARLIVASVEALASSALLVG